MIDNYKYEKELYKQGINLIGGVDEVGRGPLVGPVVAALVILPKDFVCEGLTDSKKLSEAKRDKFYEYINKEAISMTGITGLKDYEVFEILENQDIFPVELNERIDFFIMVFLFKLKVSAVSHTAKITLL